jgi:hypothetical protein
MFKMKNKMNRKTIRICSLLESDAKSKACKHRDTLNQESANNISCTNTKKKMKQKISAFLVI